MPNIWAHIQFGREIVNDLYLKDQMEDRKWKAAFQLGCQGPDFLFYDNFLPWQSSTPLNLLGTQLHNVACGPFLLSLFDAVRDRPIEHPATAFTFGFLLHHVLDRHLHPFVFSLSGFRKWHHQRFETAMDAVVMHRRAGVHTGHTPVAPEIDTDSRLPGDFSATFMDIVAIHYPVLAKQITPSQIDGAVAQMISAQKLFFDPTGWKARLTFGQLAPFSPPRQQPTWDVMNENHREWIDPCDRSISYKTSAYELWDNALADARTILPTAIAWLQAETEHSASEHRMRFSQLLGNVSYETGRECGTMNITYAESIVP
ncbi:MAG: zinc dependent phospholipase C family protein [Candidatus Cohnella colombiensis]|uniref:Zinc dependent phospholipase C family protein n=1 Tax=Candidatus Cohnella colombiensis TaxID=3121368 RepID=A0AA95JEK8_9BACL|nr:MAG: zinc dependent phospholipase C family protein [Cohnella sp.]